MDPCSQEKRITKIEDAVEKIGDQVGQLVSDFAVVKDKLFNTLDTVAEHDRILKGSDREIGMIAKVTTSFETIEELNDALRGSGKESGLIATINDLSEKMKQWNDTQKWLTRLIVGYVITFALGAYLIVH